jgi:hypothetical protein
MGENPHLVTDLHNLTGLTGQPPRNPNDKLR